jgi:cell division protein FtsI/penicillin-binding protein 2
MIYRFPKRPILLACFILLSLAGALAQTWNLKGTVYDVSAKTPMESVTVLTTSGKGTMTDSMGRYTIMVSESDSVFFSYQNKMTPKYAVAKMEDPTQFNMSLHVYVYSLPNVTVRGRSYRMDSLMNRQQYAKYFNFSKPNPLKSVNVANGGVGMDPNEIINMFRFKRNRQLAELSERLQREEQDKYVDFRFNKAFIRKLTLLDGDDLKRFMEKYRPPYDYAVLTNELEMGYYIQQCYRKEKGQLPSGVLLYQMSAEYFSD